ncbi:hypothetical protein AB3S75_011600 [Citrus x aurantiifolia]
MKSYSLFFLTSVFLKYLYIFASIFFNFTSRCWHILCGCAVGSSWLYSVLKKRNLIGLEGSSFSKMVAISYSCNSQNEADLLIQQKPLPLENSRLQLTTMPMIE